MILLEMQPFKVKKMPYFDREINKGMAIYRKYTLFSKNNEKLCGKIFKINFCKKFDSLILEVLHEIT